MSSSSPLSIVINHVRAGEFVAAFPTIAKAMDFLDAQGEEGWSLEVR